VYKTGERSSTVLLVVEAGPSVLGEAASDRSSSRFVVTWEATGTGGSKRSGRAFDSDLTRVAWRGPAARRNGLRTLSELELPPGRYKLQVVATGARTVQTESQLEVPDFGQPLSMGTVTLSSRAREGAATVTAGETSRLVLPETPTAQRDFHADETIALFTEVYESRERLEKSPARGLPGDPAQIGDHTTHVVFELRAEDGSILQVARGRRSIDRRRPGTHSFLARLSLSGVPPGRYVIRARARANIGEPDSSMQDVSIRVRRG
jgi:hypothetical protein